MFSIVNEGAYDIYGSPSKIKELISGIRPQSCIAANPEKQLSVDNVCNVLIGQQVILGDFYISESGIGFSNVTEDMINVENPIKIAPGERIGIAVTISGIVTPDIVAETGAFSVLFEDISLEFGSASMYSE